jgi:hypothetical protein
MGTVLIKRGKRYHVIFTCLAVGALMTVGYVWMAFQIIGL